MRMNERGKLYIVATPIGNLDDITFRAVKVLKSVDIIACEDTRVTVKLLNRYEIKKPIVSLHSYSSEKKYSSVLEQMSNGKDVGYVTDSGTPGISDPGMRLARLAIEDGYEVVPVPGPTAVHTALAGSGIQFNDYMFVGFLSPKKGRRRRKLEELSGIKTVFVFYESPHRLINFLKDLQEVFGDPYTCVGKELTKIFERFYRGRLSVIIPAILQNGVKGEYTIIVDNRN